MRNQFGSAGNLGEQLLMWVHGIQSLEIRGKEGIYEKSELCHTQFSQVWSRWGNLNESTRSLVYLLSKRLRADGSGEEFFQNGSIHVTCELSTPQVVK